MLVSKCILTWRQTLHLCAGLALDLLKRVEFAMDVARGMACLHAQRPIIIHRDLKTANLLVSARFEIKVADFGLSRIKDASHVSCGGRARCAGVRTWLRFELCLQQCAVCGK
jgi:serine/threonine protein kinase